MPLPADYIAALECLALVFARYRQETGGEAVLVGGAAMAIFTAGHFPSGDFDVVASQNQAFDSAMLRQARLLFRLAENLDLPYMERRIGEEGGDPAWLKASPSANEADP